MCCVCRPTDRQTDGQSELWRRDTHTDRHRCAKIRWRRRTGCVGGGGRDDGDDDDDGGKCSMAPNGTSDARTVEMVMITPNIKTPLGHGKHTFVRVNLS